ncbi:pyocin knob domain-containing protein [Paenibacillus dendritiformis]|uniref:pyocin knob domain-containing protein n=1 Tax=Paenibacillus dendritiformis TaxID=130049 RepID=UPI00248CB199|nr:pyocin knob domain-containing protein [Paenibacillus dendritiformis]WGU94106.1 pyocin knob domain-containing protein [Paenibacillus dendritiformis]
MAFQKPLPEWKQPGIRPPESKIKEGYQVLDKPPAAWLNWQMNTTYEALEELQEKAAEKEDVSQALSEAKAYTDEKVADIDLTKISPESIGAAKKADLDAHAADSVKHITVAERAAWNQAETNAKSYIDAKPWQRHKVSADDGAAIDITNRDLNSIVHTGFYRGTNLGNAPALLHGWGYVEVITHAPGSWVLQKVYDLHADRFYMRRLTDSGWTAWTQDLFQSGVDAKTRIAGAISAKGVPASANEDFSTLASKIGQIKTETPPIIQPIDFKRSNSRTVQDDWHADTWQSTIATVNMKSFLALSGLFLVENEPDLNANYNEAGVRILFKDQHGAEEQIISASYSRSRWYATNDQPIIIGRSYQATEYIINDSGADWPKGKWLQFKSTFDINGPVSIVAEFSFRKPREYSYSATLKASATGTLVYY